MRQVTGYFIILLSDIATTYINCKMCLLTMITDQISLLQQFCCKFNYFDLAYLLKLAQSAVLNDWVRCCYLYTLQLYCKLSTDYWYLSIS